MKWWIGCSGFYYKGWKGKFYPPDLPQAQWFEYYCSIFNTVELNVTFYRIPEAKVFHEWYERSPRRFRFAIKAPRLITHYRRFHDVAESVTSFYDLVSTNLRDKLGPILFQLHPRMKFSPENLDRIMGVLDPALVNVVEFRDATWWNDDAIKRLRDRGVTFCSISYPQLPQELVSTARTAYYRFHGVPELYRSAYTTRELRSVVTAIAEMKGVRETYVYFNNDIDVAAVSNAKTLMRIAQEQSGK